MQLHFIDVLIILVYLAATIFIGSFLSKRASNNMGSYFLGGNKLPWYMLGLSNASGMFDISGTMWLVTLAFLYGLKSIWIPWLWPVFNQIFLMVFLSAWLRRSNVTTGAQWIETRFGKGGGSTLSHTIVVAFALIGGLGFLAYGFIGLGKFMEIFIPWEYVNQFLQLDLPLEYVPHLYGIVFTMFAVFYTLLGGMTSIVWADVLQYTIMTIASIAIGIIAFMAVGSHSLVVPDGWMSPFFGSSLDIDWTGIITEVNSKIAEDGYSLFSAMFMMMVFKGVLVSFAGPAPNYDMQKILATKSPSEAAKMSGFVSAILMPVRYLMIAGFAALGIIFYQELDLNVAGVLDFEQILPSTINQFVPTGLLGMLLAGLLAAFMSTFSGTLNAAQAYVTNDIYLKYINPTASKNKLRTTNYLIGAIVVIVSIYLGIQAKNVNQVVQLLVSALWGGYTAANVLKWYWWRFNAHGYFYGMLSGIIISAIPMVSPEVLAYLFPDFAPDIRILYYFPVILIGSLIGCFVATYLTPPTDEQTLKDFYRTVKPWGFWKPIHELVVKDYPEFAKNNNFKRDAFNIFIGILWQTSLVALPMYLVFHEFIATFVTLLIAVILSFVLKKTWYDRLHEYDV
ncbi:MAG: Na+:solute symporter [Melioribacteraceae bacterium]|nr:Na+:solute symporter [Melioribacteraceae bacterium]MCF8265484.1 Na+:solute symporter [Melioribacteraceae bacterium]MCF8413449.1 Na+:solute symporter [Melioribacteraceae bacterium]MCF8431685.1 Na+:solute symporter [Melioribacteraceae bacterium]